MALFGPVVTYQVSAAIVMPTKMRRSDQRVLLASRQLLRVRQSAPAPTAAMYSHAEAEGDGSADEPVNSLLPRSSVRLQVDRSRATSVTPCDNDRDEDPR